MALAVVGAAGGVAVGVGTGIKLRCVQHVQPLLLKSIKLVCKHEFPLARRNTAWSHDFLQRWWESDILEGPDCFLSSSAGPVCRSDFVSRTFASLGTPMYEGE